MTLSKLSTIADKATALAGTERIETVQGGATVYTNPTQINELSDEYLEGIRALGSVALGRTIALGSPSVTMTLVDGRCYLVAVYLKKAATLTGVKFLQLATGDYTADNNNRIGLYTVSGGNLTLVASCANNGNLWKGSANTTISVAFDVPYAATAGVYYVAYLYNSSAQTTAPTIVGVTQLSIGAGVLDLANSNQLSAFIAGANLVADGTAMSTASVQAIPAYFQLY